MLRTFTKYFAVGILNTVVHWSIFYVSLLLGSSQALSNVFGFIVAVTFSFFMNARFTFNAKATRVRYCIFVGFMGALAYLVGFAADKINLSSIITLISFSGISLFLGFLYSRFVVFK